jgi:hypothetical protein
MNKYDASQKLTEEQFKRIIGARKATFAEMLSVLRKGYADKHKRRGRHSMLPVELQLMMALEYLRQYATFAELGFSYGVCESTAQNYVAWVEEMLTKGGKFRLPGKKALLGTAKLRPSLSTRPKARQNAPKKTAAMVFGQEKATHHQNATDCKQG